jgi:hypothetical protein
METPIESELIEVKSPIDRFKEQWEQQPGSLNFFRQLKVINQNPQSLQYASLSVLKGWAQPLVFALQGLLLATFLLSLANWLITKDRGKQAEQIASLQNDLDAEGKRQQGVLDATQEAIDRINRSARKTAFTVAGSPTPLSREEALQKLNTLMEETKKLEEKYKGRIAARQHELHATGDALTLANSGTPLLFSLALLFSAQVVRRGIQGDYGKFKLAREADSFYLYFAVSRGIWINCGLVLALHLWLSSASYGLSGTSESIGPIFSILFLLAAYGALIYFFSVVSKDLYKAMQIPVPLNFYSLENKILVRLHNSFWLVFLVFETALLALSYVCYFLERHIG